MKNTLVVDLFAVTGIAGVADTKTNYREPMGRVQGTRTTDSYGRTTYRDAQGRILGSSTTDRNGRTTFRDAQGRIRGSQK